MRSFGPPPIKDDGYGWHTLMIVTTLNGQLPLPFPCLFHGPLQLVPPPPSNVSLCFYEIDIGSAYGIVM